MDQVNDRSGNGSPQDIKALIFKVSHIASVGCRWGSIVFLYCSHRNINPNALLECMSMIAAINYTSWGQWSAKLILHSHFLQLISVKCICWGRKTCRLSKISPAGLVKLDRFTQQLSLCGNRCACSWPIYIMCNYLLLLWSHISNFNKANSSFTLSGIPVASSQCLPQSSNEESRVTAER